jgi:magnesium transporter
MLRIASADHVDDLVVNHARKDVLRISADDTIADALRQAQQSDTSGRIVYFYVVDEQERLQGVLPTRRLLLNPPDTCIADIMEPKVIALPATATLVEACELFMTHRLLALPVVDREQRLLGVVDVELYTDKLSDLVRWKESADVFQLIGVRLEQVRRVTAAAAFRGRFPWLTCNLISGLACAFLAASYQGILNQVILLATFIPIILTLAESVSMQSLTLALQYQAAGPWQWGTAWRAFRRESIISLLLGMAGGAVVGAVVWAWQRQPAVAAAIAAAICASVMVDGVLGLCVPMALRILRRDPKFASGPIALAITDFATLSCYFSLATWGLS